MKIYLNNVKNNIILAKSLIETEGNKIVEDVYKRQSQKTDLVVSA